MSPLIDRDALAQALDPEWEMLTAEQSWTLSDRAFAYLRTVITPEALSDAHFYGRSMDTVELCEKFVRAIFGDTDDLPSPDPTIAFDWMPFDWMRRGGTE